MYNVVAELAYTMKVTEKCDVYSFGVIIFEVLIGRHPSEDITLLSELLILSTTSKAMETYRMLRDILDQRIGAPDNGVQKELVTRPTMQEVSVELSLSGMSRPSLAKPFETITLGHLLILSDELL
ncbi:hypothetical protein MKW92_015261 [Papaver armeniacum]|nr:hypothetical protein MKW92_015261 [Papaver armeniacum]